MVWLAVTILSLIAVVGACVVFSAEVEKTMKNGGSGLDMLICFVVLAVGIVLFHVGAAKSTAYICSLKQAL